VAPEPQAPPAPEPGAAPSALWPTVLLALGLALPKVLQWELPEPSGPRLLDWLGDAAASAHEDLLFALGSGAVFQVAQIGRAHV